VRDRAGGHRPQPYGGMHQVRVAGATVQIGPLPGRVVRPTTNECPEGFVVLPVIRQQAGPADRGLPRAAAGRSAVMTARDGTASPPSGQVSRRRAEPQPAVAPAGPEREARAAGRANPLAQACEAPGGSTAKERPMITACCTAGPCGPS
jgi:hypothetical protein